MTPKKIEEKEIWSERDGKIQRQNIEPNES